MLQVLAQEKVARYASLLASFNNKKGGGVAGVSYPPKKTYEWGVWGLPLFARFFI